MQYKCLLKDFVYFVSVLGSFLILYLQLVHPSMYSPSINCSIFLQLLFNIVSQSKGYRSQIHSHLQVILEVMFLFEFGAGGWMISNM